MKRPDLTVASVLYSKVCYLFKSTLSQSIVATTVYAGNILMMEQDSELPVKEDQADITDQDHQEKNTDTENTNSDKEQELKKARIQIK